MKDDAASRLWLIDAGYLLKCQNTFRKGYEFS